MWSVNEPVSQLNQKNNNEKKRKYRSSCDVKRNQEKGRKEEKGGGSVIHVLEVASTGPHQCGDGGEVQRE